MDNAELIEDQKLKQKKIIAILRHCGSHKGCYKCPLAGKSADACMKILLDAADALEAADKRITKVESNIPIVESVLIDKLNQRIAELETALADCRARKGEQE